MSRSAFGVLVVWLVAAALPRFDPRIPVSVTVLLAIITGLGLLVLEADAAARCADGLLAVPLGFLLTAAVSQITAWSAIPLAGTFWCLLAPLAFVGWVRALRRSWRSPPLDSGSAACLVAIALAYVIPMSLRDSRPLPDGSWQWQHPDSAFHEAIVAEIARGDPPFKVPGLAARELHYHAGSHAVAAMVSAVAGLDPADSLVRVARPAGLLSLALAVMALASLSQNSRRSRSASAAIALVLLFFVANPLGYLTWRLDKDGVAGAGRPIPDWLLGNLDEYKGHLQGGSLLWALIALFTVLALLHRGALRRSGVWRPSSLELAAAAGLCLNAPVGLAAACAVLFVILWGAGSHRAVRAAWLLVLLVFVLTEAALVAPSPLFRLVEPRLGLLKAQVLLSYWFAALGSAYALGLLRSNRKPAPRRFLLAFGVLAHTVFGLLASPDWTERYLIHAWSASLLAGAVIPATLIWRARSRPHSRDRVLRSLLGRYSRVGLLVSLAGLTLLLVRLAAPEASDSGVRLAACFSAAAVSLATLSRVVASHAGRLGPIPLGVSAGALLLASVIPPGLSSLRAGIRSETAVDADRVASLHHLRRTTPRDAVLAVSVHHSPGEQSIARSYRYSALTQRRILLEGRDPQQHFGPEVEAIDRDNARLFATSDPAEAARLVRLHGIDVIVAEPDAPLPAFTPENRWLREDRTPGRLRVYRVDDCVHRPAPVCAPPNPP